MRTIVMTAAVGLLLCACARAAEPAKPDWRAFDAGRRIYSNGYIDQPYAVVLQDGTWLCVFTTGAGHEGAGGQHVVATRSADQGRTWSEPVDIEPADGPAASWAMPYLTRFGRVYVFYDYNGDRVDTLRGKKIRNDVLGWYCYKFSDDGGRTWSERHRLPVRVTACDRTNDFAGKVQIFWGIDKADDVGPGMMFAFTKLGKYMLDKGEGWFFRCDNIHTEKDPEKLAWQMLPDGEHGVRNPEFGSVQEEHNLVPLADGSLYCVYRTTLGYPAESTSRDGGRSWSLPRIMQYADGAPIKTPRACPRLFRCQNGKYLFWFHNHGGRSYQDRNPAWLAGGVQRDGRILWSQPEILIYSNDTSNRIGRFSYPDLIEQNGRYWVTCTNKETGRVHEIPASLLEGLWGQFDDVPTNCSKPLLVAGTKDLAAGRVTVRDTFGVEQQQYPLAIDTTVNRGGFAVDLALEPGTMAAGHALLDTRNDAGDGLLIAANGQGQLEAVLAAGKKESRWTTDPGRLDPKRSHRVTLIVDNGPKIITWVIDGRLCDGGADRQYGWARYDASLGRIGSRESAAVDGRHLSHVSVFGRPLRTSEAVALHRATGPIDGQ